MKTSGVIFQYREKRKWALDPFKAAFIGGILGIFILFSPLILVEAKYRVNKVFAKDTNQTVVMADLETFSDDSVSDKEVTPGGFDPLLQEKKIKILSPVDENFSIVIPKINVNSKVFANTSFSEKDQYSQILQQGVAHAQGTYLPGDGGTVYLFAHSTDYIWNINRFNAVFYLVKELIPNDEIDLVYEGKVYTYRVDKTRVVNASDTYYIKPRKNGEELILQTCWPPGTTWKRLLVFAKLETEVKNLSYSY